MTATVAPTPAQFLRADAIRGGMDLLMFAHRSHLAHADAALAKRGLGRAHHRVLYAVSRKPGLTVSMLLDALGVTKQSLGRVTNDLKGHGLIEFHQGKRDRRQRTIFLTSEGATLEQQLFEQLHENMARAYAAAGEQAVNGYWKLMQHLMDEHTHTQFMSFSGRASA